MARFNYGLFVTAGTGRYNAVFGGGVLQKNGVARTYVTPVNPATASQIQVRADFSAASAAWNALSEAIRQSFQSATGYTSEDNFTGTSSELKGKRLYQTLFLNIATADGAPATELASGPPTFSGESTILLGAVTADASAGTIGMVYTGVADDAAGPLIACVYATPPQNAGRMVAPQAEFRLIDTFESDTVSPWALGTPYVAKFGAITGATGKKIFFNVVLISAATGQRIRAGSVVTTVVA